MAHVSTDLERESFAQEWIVIFLYWLWRLGVWLVKRLPRSLSWTVAGFIGTSVYYLMPLRRRIAEENMAHVLDTSPNHPNVRRAARLAFRNFARLLRDVMLYPNLSDDELQSRITFHDEQHLVDAFAFRKGTILVSAHFGNMDLTGAMLGKRFAPATLVAETLRPPQLMSYLTDVRAKHGVYLFPYDNAPRKIIEALRRNEFTVFLLDFGITHHLDMMTVPVNFFGTETNLPTGPAQLALITGAPIVVGFTRVADDGHIHAYLTRPILVRRNGDRRTVLQTTMQEIAKRMEEFIRPTPEQWYIFRPMWRIDPAKERQIQRASLSTNH